MTTGSLAASGLPGFDYRPRTRLVFGSNRVDQVGELTEELRTRMALLVTDSGIIKAGHAERVKRSLDGNGIGVAILDEVGENPTTACVDRCLAMARAAGVDTIAPVGRRQQQGHGQGL